LDPGSRVQDWTVVRLLGVGGFGFVYEVERDGQRFALKLASLPPGPEDSERLDARAGSEVTCLRLLSHPNIVRVHAEGRWPEADSGRHFFVMDLVEGARLSDWCLRARPSLRAVVEVGGKLALALAAMHEAGVLHRDLKQDNVLVRHDGEPVLIDFGIATHAGASPLTRHILPPGTTHYRSPEALTFFRRRHFEPGGSYTFQPTDDLYALGVLLYETLTGRPPFPPHLPEPQLLGAIEFLTPPSPASLNPQVPEALSAVVMRLLAKKPEHRYADGRRLHEALAAVRDALGEAGEAPFVMEAEDPSHAPTEPLVVPRYPAGATARPPGDWVNLDELLKLVEALAGPEEETAPVKTEPALEAEPRKPTPRRPGLLERRGFMPVVAGALVLLAFCAGWLLRPAPRLATVLGRGPLLQAPAPVDRVPSSKRPMPLSGLLP
jgi:serine/threonine-protein kinase